MVDSNSEFSLVAATYNIRLGIQQGLDAVAKVLAHQSRPNILAVQEIGDHWTMGPEGDSTARLAALLDFEYYYFVPTIVEPAVDGVAPRYGHALFSKWPIEDAQVLSLPQYQDEPRALLRCTIDAPPISIEVLSTHLSHLRSDRPDQGAFLLDYLQAHELRDDARFLFGDLNAPPSEPWMRTFLAQWTDADAQKQRPTFPAQKPQRRIDYILSQHAKWQSAQVPKQTEASDHRPLISHWRI